MIRRYGQHRMQATIGQRGVAGLLLLLIVSDLGFHTIASLIDSSQDLATNEVRAGCQHSWPDDGCPLPGHSGTRFHDHHYPAVVTQVAPPVPLLTLAWIYPASPVGV